MLSIARALIRRRWIVIGLWAIIGVYATMQAPHTAELLNVRGGTNRPTESSRANEQINTRFGAPLGEYFAVTVEAPGRVDSGPSAAVLDTLVAALQHIPGVREVVTWREAADRPFLSADRRSTALILALDATTGDSSSAMVQPVRQTIARVLEAVPGGGQYKVNVTGRSPLDLDARNLTSRETRRGELSLLPLTLVILVLAFGALVAACLPLVIGFLTISVSLTIVGLLTNVTPMSVFVLTIATMIGLGVGIDYSLLIVTRFREELSRGYNRRDAAVNTILTAGGAVLWSGLTVVVGFGALIFTPLVETRSVGIGGLVVVGTAVLLATTLLPAVLATLGRTIDQPRSLARKLAWYHSPLMWEKWARSLSRHPWRALTLGLLCISILTLPLFWIRIGLPARHWWPAATEAGRGIDVLDRLGAVGYIVPVRVLVEMPEGRDITDATTLRGLRALSDSLRADPRVRDVLSIVDLEPGTSILQYSLLFADLDSARVQYPLLDTYLSRDGRMALIDVFPADTVSLTTSMDLVARARALGASPPKQLRDAAIIVGGYSAGNVDVQADLLARFPLLVMLILGATGIMLGIAFRSVLIPIKAIILNTLSVAGTFGLIVLVFQKGWGSRLLGLDGPTDAIFVVIPVIVFAVVFGLSMDYEVFLLSRIKEAFDRTGRNDEATMEGVSATASVITSAALIMILVFGVFAFANVLMMQFLGFGLAIAVLLDATIIRMVLVPAVMQLMGRWNWWPGVDPRQPAQIRPQMSGEHHIE